MYCILNELSHVLVPLLAAPEKLEQRAKPKKRQRPHIQAGSMMPNSPSSSVSAAAAASLAAVVGGHHPNFPNHPAAAAALAAAAAQQHHQQQQQPQQQHLHHQNVHPYPHHGHAQHHADTNDLHQQQTNAGPSLSGYGHHSAASHFLQQPVSPLDPDTASLHLQSTPDVRELADHWATKSLAGRTWSSELSESERNMLIQLSEAVHRILQASSDDVPISQPAPPHADNAGGRLEHAFNQMDGCIRRIISTVKLIPLFADVDKDAQIFMLKVRKHFRKMA